MLPTQRTGTMQRRSQRSTAGQHSNIAGLPVSANVLERIRQLDLDDDSDEEDTRAEITADAKEDPDEAALDAEVIAAADREGDPGDEYSSVVFYADEEDDDDEDFGDEEGDGDVEGSGAPTSPSRSPARSRQRTVGNSPVAAVGGSPDASGYVAG